MLTDMTTPKETHLIGVVEQCPDMGLIYCSGYGTGYAVTASCSRCVTTIGL